MTAALLLAAGQSRRFGREDKLLAALDGRKVVEHAMEALDVPGITRRLAVVSSPAVEEVVRRRGFEVLAIPPGDQSASLAAGIALLRGAARVLITLGDMPFLLRRDISEVLATPNDRPAAARGTDGPMPPAVFPARLLTQLQCLRGDRGAGAVLRAAADVRLVEIPIERLRDIDLPGDLG